MPTLIDPKPNFFKPSTGLTKFTTVFRLSRKSAWGGVVAQSVEHWTCDPEIMSSRLVHGTWRKNLRKVFSHLCASVTKQYKLVLAWGRWRPTAGKFTAGLSESNGGLPTGLWLHACHCGPGGRWWQPTAGFTTRHAVTCRLTAYIRSCWDPHTLWNREYRLPLNLKYLI